MDKPENPNGRDVESTTVMAPTGAVPLSEERLRLLAPQWEGMRRALRRMDDLELGEMEPATLFVWRGERP